MWTSLTTTALMALLLLSDPASARLRRKPTACAPVARTAAEPGIPASLLEIPMPITIAAGVVYPGNAKGSARPSRNLDYTRKFTTSRNSMHHISSVNIKSIDVTVPPSLKTSLSVTHSTSKIISSSSLKSRSSFNSIPSSSTKTSATRTTSTTRTSAVSSSSVRQTKAPSTTSATSETSTTIPFLRGVNLGGWLVLEAWMDSDAFTGSFSSAKDQWSFDSIPGAEAALQKHWSTYFTEDDIQKIAATGINALRIPIGYWAYNNTGTPYIQGADAWLEKAIGWARAANMKVWIDCHGSPGSQNGFDNSGHTLSQYDLQWQQAENLELSISVLKTMAAKYGTQEYADVIVGLEMTNEPISWGSNLFSVTQSWAKEAYAAVRAAATNKNMVIVMHDSFVGPLSWISVAKTIIGGGSKTFGIDCHLYQIFTNADNVLNQDQHITEACGWGANLAIGNAVMPTYVGEWSAVTNICVNPNGTTTAGTSCSVSGCQCSIVPFQYWNNNMIKAVRKYVEAQLDTFEANTSGYFIWAAKAPGAWGFLNGISNGIFPNPVTSRNYSSQCGSSTKRRQTWGSLGAVLEAF